MPHSSIPLCGRGLRGCLGSLSYKYAVLKTKAKDPHIQTFDYFCNHHNSYGRNKKGKRNGFL